MSYKFVYLLTRLDILNQYIEAISIISLIGVIIMGIVTLLYFISEKENIYPKIKGYIIGFIIMLFIVSSIQIIVPTTKEAAVIYLLPKMVNNEEVQKIPQNIFKLLNTKMEEWTNEQLGEKSN